MHFPKLMGSSFKWILQNTDHNYTSFKNRKTENIVYLWCFWCIYWFSFHFILKAFFFFILHTHDFFHCQCHFKSLTFVHSIVKVCISVLKELAILWCKKCLACNLRENLVYAKIFICKKAQNARIKKVQRNWDFATYSNCLIPLSLQSDRVNLWYY